MTPSVIAEPDNSRHSQVEVSIIIPARNVERLTPFQLDALSRQEPGVCFEVIVVDNGSVDGTVAVVESYRGLLPGLRIVSAPPQDRPGASYPRNVGVSLSRGRSLLFVDADDVVSSRYVQAMGAALRHKRFVAGRLERRLLNPKFTAEELAGLQCGIADGMYGCLPFAFGGSLGITKEAFETLGGFDESVSLAEDVDLCWRAHLAGIALNFVPEALVYYRMRSGFWNLLTQNWRRAQGAPALYRRYRGLGMPRHSAHATIRFWLGAVRECYRCRSRSDLERCAGLIGLRLGLLKGSLQHRVIYL